MTAIARVRQSVAGGTIITTATEPGGLTELPDYQDEIWLIMRRLTPLTEEVLSGEEEIRVSNQRDMTVMI